jgi:hypothetical protein
MELSSPRSYLLDYQAGGQMEKNADNEAWYDRGWLVWGLVVLLWPVGLYGLYRRGTLTGRATAFISAFLLLLSVTAFLQNPADETQNTALLDMQRFPRAVEYTVIDEKQYEAKVGRLRVDFSILAPKANDFMSRSQTLMKATREKVNGHNPTVGIGSLFQSEAHSKFGSPTARVTYAEDGNGLGGNQDFTWELSASIRPLTEHGLKAVQTWEANRPAYASDGEFTIQEEKQLMQDVAQQMGITADSAKALMDGFSKAVFSDSTLKR